MPLAHRYKASLKTVIVTLCALLALGFTAAASGQNLRVGLSAEVTSMDPQWNNSGPNNEVALHVFEALIATDEHGRLVPSLATSWRAVDPLTWELTLRKNVTFQDGSPFTAADVVFSLDRPNHLSGSPGPFTQFVRAITGATAVDGFTVRLKTATPYVQLPADLSSVFIVSKRAAEHATNADFDDGRAAIGTGPFKLVSYSHGDRIELSRYPGYWGPKPEWDKVTLRLMTNDAARLNALLAGELDVIENIPAQDLAAVQKNPKFSISAQVSWRTLFWHMDQLRAVTPDLSDAAGKPLLVNPLKDIRVRTAIAQAINRPVIIEHILEGLAIPASNLVSPGIFGYDDALKADAYNPTNARALLAQAGYPNGFQMTLHAPNNRYPNDAQVAEAVAGMLSRVGIRTKVVTLPWSAYLPRARAGEFSFAMLGWGSTFGDNTIRAQLATPNDAKGYGTWNFGRYSNPKLDTMIDKDFGLFDAAAREQSARAMMGFALQDKPVVLMYHQKVTWALRADLHYRGRVDEFTLAQQITH